MTNSPLRITLLIRSLNLGGAERQLVELARGLSRRGHRVTVVVLYPGGPLRAELDHAGVVVRELGKSSRWDLLQPLVRLARAVREAEAGVAMGFATVPNLLLAVLKPWLGGASVVWGIRASALDLRHHDWVVGATLRLSALLARRADLIVANSWAGAADHMAMGYPAAKVRVVPNGIDTVRFRPNAEVRTAVRRQWGIGPTEVLVGIVARLHPMKDHESFLRAAALAGAESPDLRFAIVGEGEGARLTALQQLASSLGVDSRVRWVGGVADPAVVYPALDLLCSASAFGEGFSNAIGEAMATGVPCVVTDVGDSAKIVGQLGVVVPARDPAALAAGMVRQVGALSPALSRACRERVVTEFDCERMVETMERLFRDLHG